MVKARFQTLARHKEHCGGVKAAFEEMCAELIYMDKTRKLFMALA